MRVHDSGEVVTGGVQLVEDLQAGAARDGTVGAADRRLDHLACDGHIIFHRFKVHQWQWQVRSRDFVHAASLDCCRFMRKV